MNNIL
jgi:hypothetical protein